MGHRTNRYRLSILVFEEPAGLWRAMAHLLQSGISPEQICLMGLPDTLTALRLPFPLDDPETLPLRHLLRKAPMTVRIGETRDLVAHCGSQMSALLSHSKSATLGFDWMQQELSQTLFDDAEQGAVVLLVSAANTEQQSTSARLLLRHGQHNLQTHEFLWPDSESGEGENSSIPRSIKGYDR